MKGIFLGLGLGCVLFLWIVIPGILWRRFNRKLTPFQETLVTLQKGGNLLQ
jgi:hypothetical protein